MPYQFTSSGLNPAQNNNGQWLQMFMQMLSKKPASASTGAPPPQASMANPTGNQMAALAAGHGPLNANAANAWNYSPIELQDQLTNVQTMGPGTMLPSGQGGFDISKYGVSTAPPPHSSY